MKDILKGEFKRLRSIDTTLAGKIYKAKIGKAFCTGAIFPKLLHGLSEETWKMKN